MRTLRHASTQALLSRKDVIIVASVSCIYGLGSPKDYKAMMVGLAVGIVENGRITFLNGYGETAEGSGEM